METLQKYRVQSARTDESVYRYNSHSNYYFKDIGYQRVFTCCYENHKHNNQIVEDGVKTIACIEYFMWEWLDAKKSVLLQPFIVIHSPVKSTLLPISLILMRIRRSYVKYFDVCLKEKLHRIQN